jgi:hypothetical protein
MSGLLGLTIRSEDLAMLDYVRERLTCDPAFVQERHRSSALLHEADRGWQFDRCRIALKPRCGPRCYRWYDAWEDRAPGDPDGLPVNFIGRSSLLRNKDATGCAKHRIDAEELRKRKPST